MPKISEMQTSFAAGEIAPSLYGRIDLAKYHIGAKTLRNMFVLPHGGVSNRAGTMFVGRCKVSAYPVHLIPFQFNLLQTYILEFGHYYMRVVMNGGYVLEPSFVISGVTNANPGVFTTSTAHGFNVGDQVNISGALGMSINSTPGLQYLVANPTTYTFTLTDLDGNLVNTTSSGAYTSGGVVARVFTLATPYNGNDVQMLKWTQSADVLSLCHPNYPPYDLNRTQHWVWTLAPVSFAPSIAAPSSVTFTNGGVGAWYYQYVITAVSSSPPGESLPSQIVSGTGAELNQTTGVANTISWSAITSATSYNIYKANPSTSPIAAGAMFGYIGATTGHSFSDLEVEPDFSQAPPQGANPFNAGPITSVSVLAGGSGYDAKSTITVTDPTGKGAVITPTIVNGVITKAVVTNGGQNYENPVAHAANQGTGAAGYLSVYSVGFGNQTYVGVTMTNGGQDYFGNVAVSTAVGSGLTFTPTITNGVITNVVVAGAPEGYVDQAPLIFTQLGGSGAKFSLGVTPSGNYPGCVTYFQQRKVFGGSNQAPSTLWMTQPGDYHNMDTSNPSRSSDGITATIASNAVNAIKFFVPFTDLLMMTASGAWKLNGGQTGTPITPTALVASPQSYVGCADLPPIVVNYDVLYVQAKGSIIRDLAYNYYANIFTGTDLSILSNHLFFGYTLQRWCYAEEPYKLIWAVRSDGTMLLFCYLKEQDVYAWTHADTPGNSGTDTFCSVATIPEQQIAGITEDSVYVVTQRTIPNVAYGQPVKYLERISTRNFMTNGVSDVTKAWFCDCGLQYNGNAVSAGGNGLGPVSSVSGLDHLDGATVSILADGNVQPLQVVTNGTISIQYPAYLITVGLPYTGQVQSLRFHPEASAAQSQTFRGKISAVTLRLVDSRGLKVGPAINDLTEIKERNATVNYGVAVPLFTGDERLVIDNRYLAEDVVWIEQDNPLPCTILGIIPDVTLGDTPG